ncbi:MAG: site-specific DNA-methyltransferase [Candidatus Gygaella obscura]|nr:site-specific DNA-methyltransferase [Candidatus Gygaella obscura]
MPRSRIKHSKDIKVETYTHKGKKRKNNPHVGLVSSATDKLNGRTKYKHDPYIDPALSWAGKAEGVSFEVQNVSLHIHERIDPKRIVKAFLKKKEQKQFQLDLFEQPDNDPPLNKAIDFYKHDQDWANRLIAGDSLLVMNSLLKKEGMAGKVQMVYIDPPYGIKYNSNFQPFVNKKDVKDGNDGDIPAEPEMIQAFRDTWELGIHSYLTHLRDRLLLARDLLHESGSCFVQISDQNIHHVREMMDEIFGINNFVSLITFAKTSGFSSTTLDSVSDYLVWYSKDITKLKYRQLFTEKFIGAQGGTTYRYVLLPDGKKRSLTKKEIVNLSLLPEGSKVFALGDLTSLGKASSSQEFEFQGKIFTPGPNNHWKASYPAGINKLVLANRIELTRTGRLAYIRYFDDFPVLPIVNNWADTSSSFQERVYVVQTTITVLQRCILMTTDPGDIVFDLTCGAGTTAYVAEQWGRRWITCDTSRVAIALAKQRLMTAKYDYFELAHPNEGIKSGFKYRTVPHITLGSIANSEPPAQETLYDQPVVEKNKVRVTGPFTVEAVPSLRVKPFDGNELKVEVTSEQLARTGETGKQTEWRDELKTTGIRATGGKVIQFSRLEPMVATRFLHAEGEILDSGGENKRAYISFGSDFGPLEQRQVEEAIKEARSLKNKPHFVIFAAFHFDPEAAKDVDQINWPGVKILKAQMSVDLLTKDLRKNRSSSHSYWLIGQPDVEVAKHKDGKYKVKMNGFDYYNPLTGEIESKGTKHIAMWFLDTDYDERSLYPDQVFFPKSDSKRDWSKLAKALNGEVNEDLLDKFSGVESLPFSGGENKKIAVKIIDNRGIEAFVVKKLD